MHGVAGRRLELSSRAPDGCLIMSQSVRNNVRLAVDASWASFKRPRQWPPSVTQRRAAAHAEVFSNRR